VEVEGEVEWTPTLKVLTFLSNLLVVTNSSVNIVIYALKVPPPATILSSGTLKQSNARTSSSVRFSATSAAATRCVRAGGTRSRDPLAAGPRWAALDTRH
jgi:hypothetical protein